MIEDSAQLPVRFHVGTIGFSYSDWKGVFYPEGIKAADYLGSYATAFDALELDTTFYAIPSLEQVRKWAEAVPANFLFCVKTPKLITHEVPLETGLPVMLSFLEALTPMREAGKLGPVLLQFPPGFKRDRISTLGAFLKQLPRTVRYAVEFRHYSWKHAATAELLASYGCAWVGADYLVEPWLLQASADFLYLRFIGQHHQYKSYERERVDQTERLQWWRERIERAVQDSQGFPKTVFTFFSDDYGGHAPATANRWRRVVGLPILMPAEKADDSPQGSLF